MRLIRRSWWNRTLGVRHPLNARNDSHLTELGGPRSCVQRWVHVAGSVVGAPSSVVHDGGRGPVLGRGASDGRRDRAEDLAEGQRALGDAGLQDGGAALTGPTWLHGRPEVSWRMISTPSVPLPGALPLGRASTPRTWRCARQGLLPPPMVDPQLRTASARLRPHSSVEVGDVRWRVPCPLARRRAFEFGPAGAPYRPRPSSTTTRRVPRATTVRWRSTSGSSRRRDSTVAHRERPAHV